MVAVTVLALGGLTVAIGTVVDSGANTAEANRVADAMTVVAEPGDVVGTAETDLRFGDGRLRTEQRTIRVIDGSSGSVVERIDSDVLVYTVGDYTVVGGNGAVLRASGGGASMAESPSIVADRNASGVLLIGAPSIDASDGSIGTNMGTRVTLSATVEHDRRDLGERQVRVAVETAYPDAWASYFEREGATIVDRDATFGGGSSGGAGSGGSGDGTTGGATETTNVVASFPGQRQAYLVVHRTELEVGA